MKYSGKMWIIIKSHKKNKASLSLSLPLENTDLEKVTATIKIWNERKLSEISKFSILGIGQNKKLGNLGNFFCFSKSISHLSSSQLTFYSFCILSYNYCQNLK